ncbi:DUF3500 domain-containing protein [Aquabacterium sp.]|jgi:hypothetical protein|uniref:DUF3500 domain-containing protein n=1 Tax=Aquabacterium sp. TaxID=1872578 RepID=UPI0025C6CE9D|nr:DUF3500 domain-containing protein [Aquabacterium sp.]
MLQRVLFLISLLAVGFLPGCGGGGGASAGSSATTTAASGSTPTITSQPASLTVTLGASATFTVTASSTSTLSYQWRKGGTAIGGATSASYTVSAVTASSAGDYDVIVSNDSGSTTSSVATLTVQSSDGTPLITSQPSSVSVASGGTATFTVTASGSDLAFQWRKDGSAISGATGSSYTLSSVSSSDAGSYTVVVSNTAGSVTSDAATLSVTTTTSSTTAQTASAVSAANAFIATLSSTQQSTVVQSYALATARHWSNLPASMVSRNGLAWSSLSTAQKTAARTLISTALGSTGNTLHLGMQAADDQLVSAYSASSSTYGSGHYYIAFLGTPSTTGFWLLQLTGHHLTFNIAFNGSYSAPTPLFLGVEPKGSFTLNGTTYDPMAAQRTAVANLVSGLSSYSGALLSGSYADLLFGANGSGNIDGTLPKSYPTGTTGRGILYGNLSSTDQAKVIEVIKAYVNTQSTAMSDELLASYLSDTALASTYVAYAGSANVTTSGAYIRVDGPRVWIEFSVQRGVIVSSDIHYHTIWRDKVGDYGGNF